MRIENKKILITSSGGNKQVIRTILEVLRDNINTCTEIVKELRGADVYSQCYSIFQYVIDNIAYVEDAGNNQYVKTPARTLADGYADCKSMAIFIACCCKALGIPCELRFVDFRGNKIYTHVYIVAYCDGTPIIIDPVERVDGLPKFDYAQPYKNKLSYKI